MTATLRQIFPSVVIIDEPGPPQTLANSLVIASPKPIDGETFARAVAELPAALPEEFRRFAAESALRVRSGEIQPDAVIFTDDHAPVEQVVHGIIWDFVTSGD
jgi:hypothetical protein